MEEDAGQFWLRYKNLVSKDLPIIIKTGIQQSTLSTWKKKKVYPRANLAVKMAQAINTTVEYLVTGKDQNLPVHSESAFEIAITAEHLSPEGLHILKCVAGSLALKYPKSISKK